MLLSFRKPEFGANAKQACRMLAQEYEEKKEVSSYQLSILKKYYDNEKIRPQVLEELKKNGMDFDPFKPVEKKAEDDFEVDDLDKLMRRKKEEAYRLPSAPQPKVVQKVVDRSHLSFQEKTILVNLDMIKSQNKAQLRYLFTNYIIYKNDIHRIEPALETAKRLLVMNDVIKLRESTALNYYNKALSLVEKYADEDGIIDYEKLAKKRSSARFYKAALNYSLQYCYVHLSRQVRQKEDLNKRHVKMLASILSTIFAKPELLKGVKLNPSQHRFTERERARKLDIEYFPADWQLQLQSAISERMKPYFAVLACTGCRPCELENGILVSEAQNGGLRFEIQNAKIGGSRVLNVSAQHPISKQLLSHVRANAEDPKVGMVFKKSANTMRAYLKNNSEKLKPKLSKPSSQEIDWREKLMLYSFRYQKATDLAFLEQRDNKNRSILSNSLGHIDRNTRKAYVSRSSESVSPAVISAKIFR